MSHPVGERRYSIHRPLNTGVESRLVPRGDGGCHVEKSDWIVVVGSSGVERQMSEVCPIGYPFLTDTLFSFFFFGVANPPESYEFHP